jgi:hypothetical protein
MINVKNKFYIYCFILSLSSCETRVSIQNNFEEFDENIHIKKISNLNELPLKIREYSKTNNLSASHDKFNNSYFSIPYFLIPEDKVSTFIFSENDKQLMNQLTFNISGKKHFKYFLRPDINSKVPQELKGSFQYIGPSKSEYFAIKTSEKNNLIVWAKEDNRRTPFIISSGHSTNQDNDLHLANHKGLGLLNLTKSTQSLFNIVSENASIGYRFNAKEIENLQQFINLEKNQTVADVQNLYLTEKNDLLKFLPKINIESADEIFIKEYFKALEILTFQNGYIFIPKNKNLSLLLNEKTKQHQFQLFNSGSFAPIIPILERKSLAASSYTKFNSNIKFKLYDSDTILIDSLKFYEATVMNNIYSYYSNQSVKNTNIIKLKNNYLKAAQNFITKYKKEKILFDKKIALSKVNDITKAQKYIEMKKTKDEWSSYKNIIESERVPASDSEYYLSPNAFYYTRNGIIIGFGLFNDNEKELMINNDSLPYFQN